MTIAGVLVAGALVLAPGVALADDTNQTATAINKAVAAEGTAPVAANDAVSVPEQGSQPLAMDTAGAEITLKLPAEGRGERVGATTVYDGSRDGSQIAVQPVTNGMRALVQIDDPSAPSKYRFAVGGDVSRLELLGDGGAAGYNAQGEQITTIDAPWARDANGKNVPTRYEVDGLNLIQVVDHRGGNYAYGIVADPKITSYWWGWTVKLSRYETEAVAAMSATGAAAYLAARLPHPIAKAAVAAGAVGIIYLARAAIRRGKCVAFKIPRVWPPTVIPWIEGC
jgi:hypothetical protein